MTWSRRKPAEPEMITHDGRTLTLRDWSRVRAVFKLGIGVGTLRQRLAEGWSPERALTTPEAERITRGRCSLCLKETERAGSHALSRLRCPDCVYVHAHETRYCDDIEAQRFVAEHDEGATLDEIGAFLGISRERARQIEEVARKRLVARLAVAGVAREDLALFVSQRSNIEGPKPQRRSTMADEAWSKKRREERAERERPDYRGGNIAQAFDREGPSETTKRITAMLDELCPQAERLAAITKRAAEIEP